MNILNFGKHKGKSLDKVPNDYKYWLLTNCKDYLKKYQPEIWEELMEKRDDIIYSHEQSIPFWFDLIDFD